MVDRLSRRRATTVVAVVTSLVGAGLVLPPAPATAASTGNYVRVSRTFAGVVPLRTRGYYPDDSCLVQAIAACYTASGNYRKEATAQVRAIRRLSSSRHMLDSPLPNSMADVDEVQWEVAPAPDSTYAPDNTAEPPEPPDPAPLAPPNCDQNTGWRIDITTDRPNSVIDNVIGMMEVKDWALGTAIDPVNRQLTCYKFKGEQYASQFGTGIRFERSTELNVPQLDTGHPWSEAYLGAVGEVWCVWADPVVSDITAGNIYFALATDPSIPELVRDYTPGCDVDAARQSNKAYKKGGAVAATAILLGIITARKIAMNGAKQTKIPVLDPPVQKTDDEDVPAYAGHYAVTAPKASTETTLQMCYGDGYCETRAIPSGTDSRTFVFSHTFSGTGTYGQSARIEETGESTSAITYYGLPAEDEGSPIVDPPAQVAANCIGTYAVDVPEDPSRTTTLIVNYGDGFSETRTIPQGTGRTTFSFSHFFVELGLFTQTFRIVETGAEATAKTLHPTPKQSFTPLPGKVARGGSFAVAGESVLGNTTSGVRNLILSGACRVSGTDVGDARVLATNAVVVAGSGQVPLSTAPGTYYVWVEGAPPEFCGMLEVS